MKSLTRAYTLWVLSVCGLLGLHRYYLGKKKTALIWQFSLGVLGLGALIDLFALPWLVKRHNKIQELKSLSLKVNEMEHLKERLVTFQKFEEAALLRDKQKPLIRRMKEIKQDLNVFTKVSGKHKN